MKNLWVTAFILCAGCAAADKDEDKKLKSGQVNQLAFTSEGKLLVAVNEYRYCNGNREKCHSRLRGFSTSSWKVAADTGELSLINLAVATCPGKSWMIQAEDFDRFGRGNPYAGVAFFKLDPVTLKRTAIDIIKGSLPYTNTAYDPSGHACAGEKPLCAVHLTRHGGGLKSDYRAFVFDLKANNKTVELQDYPTGRLAGDLTKAAIAFAPGDTHIISCQPCWPIQLQLHASDTGKLVKSIKLESPAGVLKYSPNGKMLAALCWNGDVLILEPDLSKEIHKVRVAPYNMDRHLMPDGIAFAGNEKLAVVSGSTRVWSPDQDGRPKNVESTSKVDLFDTKQWKTVRTFVAGKNRINCVAVSPDGKLLAVGYGLTGTVPGKIRVFEIQSGNLVAELD